MAGPVVRAPSVRFPSAHSGPSPTSRPRLAVSSSATSPGGRSPSSRPSPRAPCSHSPSSRHPLRRPCLPTGCSPQSQEHGLQQPRRPRSADPAFRSSPPDTLARSRKPRRAKLPLHCNDTVATPMSRGRSAMATHWPARGAAARDDRIPLAKARQLLRFFPRHIGFAPSHRSRTVQPRRSALTSCLLNLRGHLRAAAYGPSVRRSPSEGAHPVVRPLRLLHVASPHRRRFLTLQAPRSSTSDLKIISPRPTSPSTSIVFTPLSTARRRVAQPAE